MAPPSILVSRHVSTESRNDCSQPNPGPYELGGNNPIPSDSTVSPASILYNVFDLQLVCRNSVTSIFYVSGERLDATGQKDPSRWSVKGDEVGVYPYARLSSLLSWNGELYVYRQWDESTLEESIFHLDGTVGRSSIAVPDG